MKLATKIISVIWVGSGFMTIVYALSISLALIISNNVEQAVGGANFWAIGGIIVTFLVATLYMVLAPKKWMS